MIHQRKLLRSACVLALAGCTAIPVGGETISPDYAIGGGRWSTGGGITAAVRVFERGGATVVCGAWTTDRQSVLTYGLNYSVMEAASVYAAGDRLVHNLAFMPEVPYSENIVGARTVCAASARPWNPAYATEPPIVRFPRMVFNLGDADSNDFVVFRQDARHDVIH